MPYARHWVWSQHNHLLGATFQRDNAANNKKKKEKEAACLMIWTINPRKLGWETAQPREDVVRERTRNCPRRDDIQIQACHWRRKKMQGGTAFADGITKTKAISTHPSQRLLCRKQTKNNKRLNWKNFSSFESVSSVKVRHICTVETSFIYLIKYSWFLTVPFI